MVEIPSLEAGEAVEVSIICKPQSEIYVLAVYADSGRVIDESTEDNNWAFISLV